MIVFLPLGSFCKSTKPGLPDNQLYLTTNKEIYAPSETLCFQAFLVNSPVNISTSFFAELYDCSGNRVMRKKLPLENNIGSGSFVLPNIKNDYFLLYCYTLTDEGKPAQEFIKKIMVDEKAVIAASAATKNFIAETLSVTCDFEGGSFVSELSNNLLIKTSTNDNTPIAVYGKIVNQKNEVVSIFNTNEQGFVNISLVPFKNEKCTLVIKDNNGNLKTVPLPDALPEGLSFKLLTLEKSIRYLAQLNAQTNKTPLTYTLDIYKDGDAVYESVLKFDPGKSQLDEEIENTSLPEGYLTIKIKDDAQQVYLERLFYNSGNTAKANSLEVVDTLTRKTYKISLPGYISGSGCIAVNAIEKDKVPSLQINADNLGKKLNTPELNSDINFGKFNDYLISVKKINSGNNANAAEEVKFLTLSGLLYDEDQKPVKNKKVNVIIAEGKTKKQLFETLTDQNGRLVIENLVFFDTATVYYQLADKSENKNRVNLVLDKIPDVYIDNGIEKIKNYLCLAPNGAIADNNLSAKYATGSKKGSTTLNEVVVKSTITPKKSDTEIFIEKYVSPKFNLTLIADAEFDLISKPREELGYENVAQFLRSRIPGIRVDIIKDRDVAIYNPAVRNLLTNQSPPVQVYVDDNEIEPYDLLALTIDRVALIRFYGIGWRPNPGGESSGTLMIYTLRGNERGDKPVIGLPKLQLPGYDADLSQINTATQPESYKTIYWKTNNAFTGNQVIYTNLSTVTKDKTIEVKIEGINNDKIPFTFIKNIVVE